jgi:hypothetical protein
VTDDLDDGVYDGPAQIRCGDADHQARVRLTGRLDPIDGRFHWQGTIFADLGDHALGRPVTVAIEGQASHGRVAERTPWGTYAVTGVGLPPYAQVADT